MTERDADQAGIAAGMRKVFAAPTDDCDRLDRLLAKLRDLDAASDDAPKPKSSGRDDASRGRSPRA